MVNPDELDQVLRGADDGTDAALTDVLARMQHVARGESVTPTAALDALLRAPGGTHAPGTAWLTPRPPARRLAISASTVRLTLTGAVAAAAIAASVLVGQSLSRTPTTPVEVITPAATSSRDSSAAPSATQVSPRDTKAPAAPVLPPVTTTRRPVSVPASTSDSAPRETDDPSTSTGTSDRTEQTTSAPAPEPTESSSTETSEPSTGDGGSSSGESTSEVATTSDTVETVDPSGDGSEGTR